MPSAPTAQPGERTPPPPAPSAAAPSKSIGGSRDFLSLPASSYVVELAHGASRAELDAARDAAHPARGALYELHLQRDGADWWVLVWGTFDSIDSARAARGELPADALRNAGWPRRIAPLQAEVQHAGG